MEALSRIEKKRTSRKFVVCLENTGYPVAFEKYKIYRVLPDRQAAKDDFLRVIDESGEDYLYPASMFAFLELPSKVRRAIAAS